jgi:DNA-binding SARP family transcriptional activator
LTQRELAERSGVSIGAIRDLEQGRTALPRPGAAESLARVLGLSPRQLVEQGQRLEAAANGEETDRQPSGGPSRSIRLSVLGPLVARRGGALVDLGAQRQRTVLAMLALQPGHVVHRETIVDAIWGETPPPSAVGMVQSHISRLRDVLGGPARSQPPARSEPGQPEPGQPEPGDPEPGQPEPGQLELGDPEPGGRDGWLVSVGESYKLRADAERLDLLEFGDLLARARGAVAAGDAAGACEVYERALGLWRGDPAADVTMLRGHPAVTGLARQRAEAVLEYAEAAAAAGCPDRVLEHVRALADREPLDERVHARLMIGLAATGQQAAALRVFEQLRARLDHELGITPGPELSDARMRILRGEVDGQAGPLTAGGSATPREAPRERRAGPGGTARPGRTTESGETARPVRATGPGSTTGPVGSGEPSGAREREKGIGAPPRPRSGPVLPRQLPSAPRQFAGRAGELKALWEVLDQAGDRPGAVVISAIGGMAGIGKTALAVHWAHEVADRFPDGQLFVDLHGVGPVAAPAEPAQVIAWFLASLGVPVTQIPADPQAQAALYRSVLADKRVLIVLDNARDADQVRPLLPGSPGCLVLVTSRTQLTGLVAAEGAHLLPLDVLDQSEAHELLASRLGPDRLVAEPRAVGGLVELCGRLPLALAITAARAAARPGFSLAVLADELRDEADRLDALDTGESASSVRQVFSWSGRQLTDPAARMFRLLGLHPGPQISVAAAASLAGVSPGEARRALAELTGAHLLTEPDPGRYALHDLLRAYATEQAHTTDTEAERHAAIHRTLDHYLHTAHAAALVISPARAPIPLDPPAPGVTPEPLADHPQAMAWFDAERQVLVSAITQAAENGPERYAWRLAWATTHFLDRRGYWHEKAAIQRTALGAAERIGDKAGQATAHRFLATACIRLADYGPARVHLTDCIKFYREVGDRHGEAHAQMALTVVAVREDRTAEALGHSEQALGLFRVIDDRIGQAVALNNVGWCHVLLGDYERGRTVCQEALVLDRELGERHSEAHILDSLARAEHNLGNLTEAARCYRQALDILQEVDDRYLQAEILSHLGDTHHAAGDRQQARNAWREALAIYDDLDHPDAQQVRARLGA